MLHPVALPAVRSLWNRVPGTSTAASLSARDENGSSHHALLAPESPPKDNGDGACNRRGNWCREIGVGSFCRCPNGGGDKINRHLFPARRQKKTAAAVRFAANRP